MRADFQQYYGLNLDGMGHGYSIEHAACLAAQLPRESRTIRAISPAAAWGWTENLLANIEYWLHVLAWTKTKDGEKGRNKPQRIDPSDTEEERKRRHERAVRKRAHVDSILGKR